jgi:4-amino-4-deoxy-L-arabinose transferase-like glycosyltransferase
VDSPGRGPEPFQDERKTGYVVLVAIAVLYLTLLSMVGIFDPEEGRHVSVATAMLRTHDLVVPQLQGFPYLEKPPLAYWMIAAAFEALGRSEFAARLPVAAMGLAGIAAVFVLARRVVGARAAWLSAGVLALTTQWFIQARYMTTDMILSGWIAIALVAFYLGFHTQRRLAYLLFYFAMAMATLSKGIIGVVLPCAVVAVFVTSTRRFKVLRDMRPVVGAGLFVSIVAPWFLLVERRVPEFLRYFIVDQHVARFVGNASDHPAPLWFFVPVIAFGFFPWIVNLPAAASRARERKDLSVFLWAWFAVIFLFFSASRGKLMGYVLPSYPPLALLVGTYAARLWNPDDVEETNRRICRAAWVSACVFLALAPIPIVGLGRFMGADGRLAVFLVFIGGAAAADQWLGTKPIGVALAQRVQPDDLVVLYRMPQPSLEYYLRRPPILFDWTGELAWGMTVRPDPSLVMDDPSELKRLLSSSRTVWVVTRAEDHAAPQEFGVPMELVAGNRKRTIYTNHVTGTR